MYVVQESIELIVENLARNDKDLKAKGVERLSQQQLNSCKNQVTHQCIFMLSQLVQESTASHHGIIEAEEGIIH